LRHESLRSFKGPVAEGAAPPNEAKRGVSESVEDQLDVSSRVEALLGEDEIDEAAGPSLYCFGPDSWMRQKLFRLIRRPEWDVVVLALIVASCITLALESPVVMDSKSDFSRTLKWIDFSLTSVFLLDILLRCIAFGAVSGPRAYFSSPWNVADGVIVLLSFIFVIVSFYVDMRNVSYIAALRALRAVRPFAKIESLRMLFLIITTSFGSVTGVIVFITYATFVFSVLGVQLFAGGFHHCECGGLWVPQSLASWSGSDASMLDSAMVSQYSFLEEHQCAKWLDSVNGTFVANASAAMLESGGPAPSSIEGVAFVNGTSSPVLGARLTCTRCEYLFRREVPSLTSEGACEAAGMRWVNSLLNFDTILNALQSASVMVTGEGWATFMYRAMDIGDRSDVDGAGDAVAYGRNINVRYLANPYFFIYFVFFMLISAVLLVNLFTGSFYSYFIFHKNDAEDVGHHDQESANLLKFQNVYKSDERLIDEYLASYTPPNLHGDHSGRKQRLLEFLAGDTYKSISIAVIVVYIVSMLTVHEGMGTSHAIFIAVIGWMMTLFITAELMAKVYCRGFAHVFRNKYNVLDLLIVLAAFFSVLVLVIELSYDPADHSRESSSAWHDKFDALITLRLIKVGRVLRTAFRVAASSGYLVTALRSNLKALKKVQIIMETSVALFVAFVNIALLIVLVLYFFAIVAMNIFGRIRPVGEHLNGDWNFSDFPHSMATLMRMTGGEDWQLMFEDIVYLDCNASLRLRHPEMCPEAGPFAFFMLFFITVVFVLLSLFIATIIDVFTSVIEQEYSDMSIEHIYGFTSEWMRVCKFAEDSSDRDARNSTVSVQEFKRILGSLCRPIGVVPIDEETRTQNQTSSTPKDANHWHLEALLRTNSVLEEDWFGSTRQRQLAAYKEAAILNKCNELNLTTVNGRLAFGTTLRLCLRYSAMQLNPFYVHKFEKSRDETLKRRRKKILALGRLSLLKKKSLLHAGPPAENTHG